MAVVPRQYRPPGREAGRPVLHETLLPNEYAALAVTENATAGIALHRVG